MNKTPKVLKHTLLALAVGIPACLSVAAVAAYTIFAPDRFTFIGAPYTPSLYANLPQHADEIYFGADNKVNGWMFKSPHPEKVLLFSHGTGRNVGMNEDRAEVLAQSASVFLYDYRGTGKSAGQMSEQGMIDDACAAYDLLIKQYHYKPEQIIGYGESLGTAVTAQLSLRRKLGGVIMVAGFPSWLAAAQGMAPTLLLLYPSSWYPVFDSASALKQFKGPTLIIHGAKDRILTVDGAKQLFDAAVGEPKQFVLLPGSAHDYNVNQPEADRKLFCESIRKFVSTDMKNVF